MQILGVVLMAIGLVGMIFCSKKQKTNPAMQPVALGLFVVVIIGAVLMLKTMFGDDQSTIDNELRFANSRGFVAGKFIAAQASGKKVLFVAYPNYEKNEHSMGVIKAFKDGFGSENVVVDTLKVPADFEESGRTIEEFMQPKDFDELLAKHADAAVVVTVIGLPEKARNMKAFKAAADKRPVFFLINQGMFAGKNLVESIKNGTVAGILIPSPTAKYDVKAPGDLEKAFAIRYVLVDKNNLDANKNSLQP